MADAAKFTSNTVRCRHCESVARLLIIGEHSTVSSYEGSGWSYDAGDLWEMLMCEGCSNVSLRSGHYDDRFDDTFEWTIIYPNVRGALRGLPRDVSTAYRAAARVRTVDPNLFAVALGRVLEYVCIDQGAVGKSLDNRLRDLADRGIIPGPLADIALAIQSFRNVGAHAGSGDLSHDEAPILDSLCEAVLEFVYVAPLLLDAAKARLRERKSSHPRQ